MLHTISASSRITHWPPGRHSGSNGGPFCEFLPLTLFLNKSKHAMITLCQCSARLYRPLVSEEFQEELLALNLDFTGCCDT